MWYAATSEVPWLFLLAAWLIGLAVAVGMYAWWNGRGLSLHLDARSVRPAPGSPLEDLPEQVLRTAPTPAAIFEGDSLELEVGLDTAGAARGPASVAGNVGGKRIALATGLVPRGGWREVAVIPRVSRGALGAASWEIGSGDFLGFFRGRFTCEDEEIGLVFPRFASLSGRRVACEMEAGLAAPRAGLGSEPFSVREYRSGDSLRRIHWRSSARHGELIVREYEPPGVQMLNVALDCSPHAGEVADQIARIAASEAWDCIREGGRVRLLAPGLESMGPSRDLWSVLEWLARYPDLGSVGPAEASAPRGEETVAVTAGGMELAPGVTRVWVVGEAVVDTEAPVHRVGIAWPL